MSTSQYAGFWRRVVAAIIDGILLGIVNGIIAAMFFSNFASAQEVINTAAPIADGTHPVANGLSLLIGWLYYAAMESSEKMGTLGKMAIGIKVTDLSGKRVSFARATGRHFAKIISAIILFIGFIMAAFTPKKQALHDMIAGTLVVQR